MAPILTVSICLTVFKIFTLHITGKSVQVLLCPEDNCYVLKLKHSQQTKDEVPKFHKSNLQDSCLYLGVLRFSTSKKNRRLSKLSLHVCSGLMGPPV